MFDKYYLKILFENMMMERYYLLKNSDSGFAWCNYWLIPTYLVNRDILVKMHELTADCKNQDSDMLALTSLIGLDQEAKECAEKWGKELSAKTHETLVKHWQNILDQSIHRGEDDEINAYIVEIFNICAMW